MIYNNLPQLHNEKNEWNEERRQEIIKLFEDEVYGKIPTEFKMKSELVKSKSTDFGLSEVYNITIETNYGTHTYPFFLNLPTSTKKLPVIIYIGNRPRQDSPMNIPSNLDPQVLQILQKEISNSTSKNDSKQGSPALIKGYDLENDYNLDCWPVDTLVSKNYATISFYTEDLEPDKPTDYKQGIFKIFDGNQRNEKSWGAISAWAFGVLRIVDAIYDDERFDNSKIAVAGHSRGGKTALWASANDKRITSCFSNNSGCTGAAISRGKQGENLLIINNIFPHWFCDNYNKYNNNENNLPIDQHMLIALSSPRYVYITSATKDLWADPKAEFMGAKLASVIWEDAGLKGLECQTQPKVGDFCNSGYIGYHIREGEHDLTRYDWDGFCDFWSKHLHQ